MARPACTCAARCSTRDWLQGIGGFQSPHNLFQDVVAEVILLGRHGGADIQQVKASFRKHDGELTHAARVSNWCEDSRFVVDTIVKEFPEHAERLEAEGNRFMTRVNYNRANGISSPFHRLRTYVWVYFYFQTQLLPAGVPGETLWRAGKEPVFQAGAGQLIQADSAG